MTDPANLPTIEKRMATLLMLKLTPYTIDGINHFLQCPKAEEFRRQKAAKA